MTKALPIELRIVENKFRKNITSTARLINTLPIDTEHKVLFMEMIGTRGIKEVKRSETNLIAIYDNTCEVMKLLLQEKLCGISTMATIALRADKKRRVYIYQEIRNNGIKATRDEINKLLAASLPLDEI